MNELAYIQTSIGDFVFPFVFRIDHESNAKITSFPVHQGASITDHMYIEPSRITIEIGASDVMMGDGESILVYEKLREIQSQREPLELTTRLFHYDSVVIESISVPDDNQTQFGLKATVVFQEIIIASTSILEVSGGNKNKAKKSRSPSKKKNIKRGEVQSMPLFEKTTLRGDKSKPTFGINRK